MLVLLTTSNFPDIMLPAYQINRANCIFFMAYLVIGLIFLMNLLLGIFYNNFKFRFEMNLENSKEKRSEYLFSRYLDFGGDKGYLDKTETYQMFLMIHGLASASLKNQVVSKEEADEELNKSMAKRASNVSQG